MFCENCGYPITDGARFCENCGTPIPEMDAAVPEKVTEIAKSEIQMSPMPDTPGKKRKRSAGNPGSEVKISGRKVTENIYLCPDGKYRWIYEYEMLKNPTILFTILKVILLSFGIVMGFMVLLNLIDGSFHYWNRSDFVSFFGGGLVILLVLLALSVVSYLILAAVYGWTYLVLLTMDEEGVELKQMKKEFQKSQAIGWLTLAAGLVTGNIGQAGTGILAATRDSSASVFQDVRKVKAVRRRHVIYVNQLLGHNQVYAEDADFEFVWDYIAEHCPNAKVIR